MNATDRYLKDLDSLIGRGVDLQRGLYNELKDEFKLVLLYKNLKRKSITNLTYTISDYLQSVEIKNIYGEIIVSRSNAVLKFQQQYLIVQSLKHRFESSLYGICQLVQVDMMDSEVDSAKLLLKNGFLRAAGAICGVVLEKHFAMVCESRNLKPKKKNPCINDYNQLLKDEGVIDTATWRHIQLLGDIRNLCDHNKEVEPTKSQIEDLLIGTDKIIKTVF